MISYLLYYLLALAACSVFLFYRIYRPYSAWWHYTRQDCVKCPGFPLPLIGNLKEFLPALNRENKHPFVKALEIYDYHLGYTKSSVGFLFFEPYVIINDVKVVEDLYTRHNQFFCKHPLVQKVSKRLLGNSILFCESGEGHKARRKALSPAFYRGKLTELLQTAND